MAWTSPRTWTTGEIVTAAMLNEQLRDNTRYLKGLDGDIQLGDDLDLQNYYLKNPGGANAAGQIYYNDGTGMKPLAAGTLNYVLKCNGAAAPSWASVSAAVAANTVIGSATHTNPGAETDVTTIAVPEAGGILTWNIQTYVVATSPSCTATYKFYDKDGNLVAVYGTNIYQNPGASSNVYTQAIATNTVSVGASTSGYGMTVVHLKPAAAGNYKVTVQFTGNIGAGCSGQVTGTWNP